MATCSIIDYLQLEQERIDSEFYEPLYLDTLGTIRKQPHQKLGDVCSVTSGSTPPDRKEGLAEGIVLLKTVNIQNGYINFDDIPFYIDERLDEQLKATRLRPYDILLNVVGATLEVIGRVAMVPPSFPKANITQAMALIRLKREATANYYPEYVFAFLLSDYGRTQVSRLARPSGQYNLNHEEVRSIRIPKIGTEKQKLLRTIVADFFKEWNLATAQHDLANSLLLSELELGSWNPKDELAYVKNYEEVTDAQRIDAEYFQPKYDEIIALLTRFKPVSLESFAKQVIERVKLEPEKSYRYIEISDVDTSIGDVSYTERMTKDLPSNAKIKVRGGELIVSKVRPTRGAIGLVPTECAMRGVCSSAFSIYKIESPMREFTQIFLRSILGKIQLERPSKGASYPTIEDGDVANVLVPTIRTETVARISQLVNQSFIARHNAKAILEKAKDAVSKMVST